METGAHIRASFHGSQAQRNCPFQPFLFEHGRAKLVDEEANFLLSNRYSLRVVRRWSVQQTWTQSAATN
jgi:hypothetical protein